MVNPFLTFPLYLLVPTLISGLILYTVILRLIPDGAGDTAFLALAAGSTIAGNLTIPGAASNIIIIQNAEHRGATITFMEFLRFGIPVTILQSLVFLAWFLIIT